MEESLRGGGRRGALAPIAKYRKQLAANRILCKGVLHVLYFFVRSATLVGHRRGDQKLLPRAPPATFYFQRCSRGILDISARLFTKTT
jgi:hypothetical protein